MGVLRSLLTVTWAAWIWLELMAVAGPAVLNHLHGRGRPRQARSVAVLLASAGAGFVIGVRVARLPAGALPGAPELLLVLGLAVMWGGLALRAWSLRQAGGLFRSAVAARRGEGALPVGPYRYLRQPAAVGALVAAGGFGVALAHWTSLLILVAAWCAGIAWVVGAERE
ncbi:MAG TPA: methyltransferase [Terriglobales bacterium]|nr:methyltransferase [Terriglobales bacterium]